MTEVNHRKPSSPSLSPTAPYYGLATQLRTPPADFTPSFPMTKSLSSSSVTNSAKAPKKVTPAMRDEFGFAPKFVPQWSSKGEQNQNAEEDVQEGGDETAIRGQGSPTFARTSPKQSRTSGRHSTAPRPTHTPHLSQSGISKHQRNDSLRDTPVFGKVDFNFKPMQQPLDLTVTLDPVESTTYRIEEQDEGAVAPTRQGSLARARSMRPNTAKSPALDYNSVNPTQASPTVPPASSNNVPAPSPMLPDSFTAAFPLSRTITPAAKGSMNLITLARRTTHLADVPGYGWRLDLLEKLEVLTGSFIAIRDAESILSIGQSQATASKASKLESRKSQIFMPTSAAADATKLKRRPSKSKAEDHSSFFSKMKRALSHPGVPHGKDAAAVPPMPPPKRVVFGQKLSQIAEYAFVTSMIAGQRHDLPGVCFSTVEEIYRRGQGSKVPGLLQLAGEPGRVARLVQIFDSAPDYGEHHDLSVESIHNVCSLLKKYLHDLPESVLDERVYRLFLSSCVDSSNSLPRRVASAQIILRLLPTANFSLLVYLVAFLSQIPLFPSNPLALTRVSEIFAASIMAPRKAPSSPTTASLSKKPKAQMIITGPADLATDHDGKKANQALEWLLSNWSAVADGLLEPDFDVDIDAIVHGHEVAGADEPVAGSPPMVPIPTSPANMRTFDVPQATRAAPAPPSDAFSTYTSTAPPPVPFVESVPPKSVDQVAGIASSDVPQGLDSIEDEEEEEESSDEATTNDPSLLKTSRPMSDSSYATSIATPPGGHPEDQRGSKLTAHAARLSPEDENGPLDFASMNVGDDVVEFDDYSSVYSFPAPPTTVPSETYRNRLPSLPPSPFLTQDEIAIALAEQDKAVRSATIPQSSTFAPLDHGDQEVDDDEDRTEDLDVSAMSHAPEMPAINLADFEPRRPSVSAIAAPHLVRSKSVQLEESRNLIQQQRLEIQSLWSKLTGLESERTQERQEMLELTNEVEGFKHSLRAQVEQVEGGEQLRAELEQVRTQLKQSEEDREQERKKSREQVENLEKQLADIRKVLVPLLGNTLSA